MTSLYHELASGKDSSLSYLMSEWSKRYDDRLALLQSKFGFLVANDAEHVRPKSFDMTGFPTQAEFQEQFEEVLELKTSLVVVVEALEQIRTELEDSESISEVHIRLERITLENRRLQSALRIAQEQVSDLFFNKRVLEAEMTALRSDRDQKLTEANERVRAAQRALLAASRTSREANQREKATAAPSSTAPTSPPHGTNPLFGSFHQYGTDGRHNMKVTSLTRQFATLTAISFDDLASLDSDESEELTGDSDNNFSEVTPPTTSSITPNDNNPIPTNLTTEEAAVDHLGIPVGDTSLGTAVADDVESEPNANPPDVEPEDKPLNPPCESILSTEDTNTFLVSPTSSSTPIKYVTGLNGEKGRDSPPPNPAGHVRFAIDLPLPPPPVSQETDLDEFVSKEEYLKLLDELDEVRSELDSARRSVSEGKVTVTPTIDSSNQSASKRDSASSMSGVDDREVILPPYTPGATRVFDWSISPDQSTLPLGIQQQVQVTIEADPITATTTCNNCLELQARLSATEVIHAAILEVTNTKSPDDDKEILLSSLNCYRHLSDNISRACSAMRQRLLSVCHIDVSGSDNVLTSIGDLSFIDVEDQKDTALALYRVSQNAVVRSLSQLNTNIGHLVHAISSNSCKLQNGRLILNNGEQTPTDKDIELNELRSRLARAHELFAEQLNDDARTAINEAAQMVELERLQFQAELDRRMTQFEQNQTNCLTELEASRRDLLEQLASLESANVQMRDELNVVYQKLASKERFLTEQLDEREQEREEFKTEIKQLENELRSVKDELTASQLKRFPYAFGSTSSLVQDNVTVYTPEPSAGPSPVRTPIQKWPTSPNDFTRSCNATSSNSLSNLHKPRPLTLHSNSVVFDEDADEHYPDEQSLEQQTSSVPGDCGLNDVTCPKPFEKGTCLISELGSYFNRNIISIEKATQFDQEWEHVSVQTIDLNDMTVSRGIQVISPTNPGVWIDVACETENTEIELIPSTELSTLIGQLEAAEVVTSTLRAEVESLTKFQVELQADYTAVHEILESRELELDRVNSDFISARDRVSALERQLSNLNDVREIDEDLFLLKEQNESLSNRLAELEHQRLNSHQTSCTFVDVGTQSDIQPAVSRSTSPIPSNSSFESLIRQPHDFIQCDLVMPSTTESQCETVRTDDTGIGSEPVGESHLPCSTFEESSLPAASVNNSSTPYLLPEGNGPISSEQSATLAVRDAASKLCPIAYVCQPNSSSSPNSLKFVNNSSQVSPDITQFVQRQQTDQLSVLNSLLQANNQLKDTLTGMTQTIERFESPTVVQQPLVDVDALNREFFQLINCMANALSSDEAVWLALLNASVTHSVQTIHASLQSSPEYRNEIGRATVWSTVDRLLGQLAAFMRQEDKYRRCILQAHVVEVECLKSELATAHDRTQGLSAEVTRLSERLTSQSQALTQSDSLTLRLAGEVTHLKNELANANSLNYNHELHLTQRQVKADNLGSQLAEEQRKVATLQSQLTVITAEKNVAEQQLATVTNDLKDTKSALLDEQERLKHTTVKANDFHSRWKAATELLALNSDCTLDDRVTGSHRNEIHSSHLDSSCNGKSTNSRPILDLLKSVDQIASYLSSARRSANESGRRLQDLQATNKALQLQLTEAELRSMPALSVLAREWCDGNRTSLNSRENDRRSSHRRTSYDTGITSANFAELRNVCKNLLHLASSDADDQDDQDESLSYASSGSDDFPMPNGHQDSAERELDARATDRLDALPDSTNLHTTHIPSSFAETSTPVPGIYPVYTHFQDGQPIQTVPLDRVRVIYIGCLRAESYRRALAFQKRYLILLLGGFQYPEDVVLASLSRSESFYADEDVRSSSSTPRGIAGRMKSSTTHRFRTVTHVIQAVHRMRRMVTRWHRFQSTSLINHSNSSIPAHPSPSDGSSKPHIGGLIRWSTESSGINSPIRNVTTSTHTVTPMSTSGNSVSRLHNGHEAELSNRRGSTRSPLEIRNSSYRSSQDLRGKTATNVSIPPTRPATADGFQHSRAALFTTPGGASGPTHSSSLRNGQFSTKHTQTSSSIPKPFRSSRNLFSNSPDCIPPACARHWGTTPVNHVQSSRPSCIPGRGTNRVRTFR